MVRNFQAHLVQEGDARDLLALTRHYLFKERKNFLYLVLLIPFSLCFNLFAGLAVCPAIPDHSQDLMPDFFDSCASSTATILFARRTENQGNDARIPIWTLGIFGISAGSALDRLMYGFALPDALVWIARY